MVFNDDNKEIEDEIKQSIAVKRIKKKTIKIIRSYTFNGTR